MRLCIICLCFVRAHARTRQGGRGYPPPPLLDFAGMFKPLNIFFFFCRRGDKVEGLLVVHFQPKKGKPSRGSSRNWLGFPSPPSLPATWRTPGRGRVGSILIAGHFQPKPGKLSRGSSAKWLRVSTPPSPCHLARQVAGEVRGCC